MSEAKLWESKLAQDKNLASTTKRGEWARVVVWKDKEHGGFDPVYLVSIGGESIVASSKEEAEGFVEAAKAVAVPRELTEKMNRLLLKCAEEISAFGNENGGIYPIINEIMDLRAAFEAFAGKEVECGKRDGNTPNDKNKSC